MVEFNFYIKNKDTYEMLKLEVPVNSGWDYLKKLKLSLEQQADVIRNDIREIYPNIDKEDVFLPNPRIDNIKKQEKLDKLVEIRKINKTVYENILSLLQSTEFIICEHCKGKMIKTPIGVRYERLGNNFVILDNDTNCKWVYMCENCFLATSEHSYITKKSNLALREDLISKGFTFVPNEYGIYNVIPNKPIVKQPELKSEDIRPRRRLFESVKILGVNNPFIKIVDEYPDTGERIQIK